MRKWIERSEPMNNITMDKIVSYLNQCPGLDHQFEADSCVKIKQKVDGKELSFESDKVEEVIDRIDSDGKDFIQVNFYSGAKILLTQQLVGFKPVAGKGLDLEKLPNVVTTPDLFSVFEAIQEALSEETEDDDVDILKRVFEAVVLGGEAIGFDLTEEKMWLQRLTFAACKTSA